MPQIQGNWVTLQFGYHKLNPVSLNTANVTKSDETETVT